MVACQFNDNSDKALILNNYSPAHSDQFPQTSPTAQNDHELTRFCAGKSRSRLAPSEALQEQS
jgi:hypothetical protein